MAIKLFAEFKSDQGQYYKIAIHDEDYSGSSPDEFKVTSSGFQLSYSGDTDNIYSPMIGSSVSFGMYITDAATRAFLTNVKSVQEDRFFIEVFDGTESSPTLFWRGFIAQDILQVQDVSEPYVLEIVAIDGISKMSNEVCAENGVQQLTIQFLKALNEIGYLSLFDTNDVVLNVVCNWWAQSMTFDANNNPLDETFVDMSVFGILDEEGAVQGVTWNEVLSKICQTFGLRFYFSRGQYRLEQLFALDGTFTEHTYKKAFATGAGNKVATKIGQTTGVSHTKTIDQTSNQARLAGNIFNFLPAVHQVRMKVNKHPKAVAGSVFLRDEVTPSNDRDPVVKLGLITTTQSFIRFEFFSQLELRVSTAVTTQNFYIKLKLNVKLSDQASTDVYYLKRTIDSNLQPSAKSWTTTQSGSGYEILFGPISETIVGTPPFNKQIHLPLSVHTPIVPVSGDVEFDWDFVEYVNQDGTTRTLNSNNKGIHEVITTDVFTSSQSIVNQTTDIVVTNANANLKSAIVYELMQTDLFTGFGRRGTLLRHQDIGGLNLFFPHTNFREGNSGTYRIIEQFVCEQFLRLMNTTINKYQGQFFSNFDFRDRLTFDSRNWVQLSGTFTANTETWDSECFVISKDTITSSFDDNTFPSDLRIGNNSFDDGFISPQIDSINTNVEGMMSTNGGVKTSVNAVTGNDDSSPQSVGILNNMNFVTFGSGTGSYTINLPTAVGNDGLKLSFASDDSVSASHVVVLDANGSETIDGSATYSINRNFAGVTLMAYESNWVVIQEKNAT